MKEQEIRLLEDRDHCRLRRGMYIPNVNYFIYELVDNCVDQFMAGFGDTINVIIDEDGSIMVQDFASGLPIGDSKDEPGTSQAELALSRLQAGGKFDDNGIKSAGLNGVGASCINFLSAYFMVRISKNNRLYGLDFTQGIVSDDHLYELEMTDEYPESGTLIITAPDPEIWNEEEIIFDINAINRRLKQLTYLNPGLTINFEVNDYNGYNIAESYCFNNGVGDYINELTSSKELLFDPIYTSVEVNDIEVDIALAYTEAVDHTIIAFTNNVPNTDNKSSHLVGFKAGLADAIKDYQADITTKLKNPISAEDTREGVVAIISIKIASPVYIGQGKDYINMPIVRKTTAEVIKECMEDYIDKNPNSAKLILEKALEAQRVRETVKKAKETARKSKGLIATTKPEKLVKCVSKVPEDSVIWLVEGDSAAGSAKQARNEQIDAIFPAFGKINNTYDYSLDKILVSSKILDVVKILECGIGEDFDIEKLRYHKIIILSDADEDGRHIQCLWATFFWKHLPQIIEQGMLYFAIPPLYAIKEGKNITYAYSDTERDNIISTISRKYEITRYKGLGEQGWKELRESTMSEESRRLIRITNENIEYCEQILDICMNDKAIAARKEFIMSDDIYDLV